MPLELTGLVVHEPPYLPRLILHQPAPFLQERERYDACLGDLLRAGCRVEHGVACVDCVFRVDPLEKGDTLPWGILCVQLEREG